MERRFLLGVSTSIFPGLSLSRREYALLARHGVDSVEIGYEQMGPALLDAQRRRQLVALAEHARPPVCSAHAPYRPSRDLSAQDEPQRLAAVEHAREALTLASQLGARQLVIHASEDPILPGTRPGRLGQARASLGELVPEARALNLRLALETMPPEWLPASVREAFELVEGLDPRVIGFCLDTNHSNLTEDLPSMVLAMESRLLNVHLSDNDAVKQRHWMPLKGVIDWGALLGALDAVSYRGPLHYELDPHPSGPERGLQEISGNFQQLLALGPGQSAA